MADTDKPKSAAKPAKAPEPAKEEASEVEAPEKPSQQPPHVVMRALLGFSGLSLLVGFFLPWVRVPAAEDGSTSEVLETGFNLVFQNNVQGTPSVLVMLVPILGALLSAASFMGFRYAAQTAITVSMSMLLYGLYVLFSMFVHLTAYGLWTVAGGTFVILLLGIATYVLGRRGGSDDDEEEAEAPKEAPSKTASAKS
jgi:hypothetical protein